MEFYWEAPNSSVSTALMFKGSISTSDLEKIDLSPEQRRQVLNGSRQGARASELLGVLSLLFNEHEKQLKEQEK